MTWGKERSKLGHAKTSKTIRKLGDKGASLARFPEMTTASVSRMARPEETAELDELDK